MANEPRKKPDPNDPDAAGEGWSEDGDAWYHEGLLGTEEEDEAEAEAYSRKKGWLK